MCCFSGKIESVSGTQIFGRFVTAERQALAYQMTLKTAEDVAMILPLPVVPGSGEKAVQFLNLEKYGTFFDDLAKGFSVAYGAGKTRRRDQESLKLAALEVHSVGSFEASFVPTTKDFNRLDERFRLPKGTWEKLPQYANYGFAVFKLKKGHKKLHPMAFTFPSALAEKGQIFFPTVHIHDGEVHKKEEFDHRLYAQTWPKAGLSSRKSWEESPGLASGFTKPEKSKGLLWGGGHVYRMKIKGRRKNEDIIGQAIKVG